MPAQAPESLHRQHNWDIFIHAGQVGQEKGLLLEMQSQCRGQENQVSVDPRGVIQALEQAELAGTFRSSLDSFLDP